MTPDEKRAEQDTTPLKLFSAGLVVTILIFAGLGIYTFFQYLAFDEAKSRNARLYELIGQVRSNDNLEHEVLIRAIATGYPEIRADFEQAGLDHEQALGEIIELARLPESRHAAEEALKAHEIFHDKESTVFDGILAGSRDQALAAVSDPAYEQAVTDYFDSVEALALAIQDSIGKDVDASHTRILSIVLIITAALLLIAAAWLYVIRAIRQYINDRDTAEEKMRMALFSVRSASDAIYWIGPDARFIYMNDQASKALGYSLGELASMSVHDIDPIFTAEVWPAHWQELRRRQSMTIESRHRRKDGTEFPVEIAINYLKIGSNEYNFAFVRDISERKRLEDELSRRQNRLEESQKIAQIGSWEYDLRTASLWWSDEVYRMLGLDTDTPVSTEMYLDMVHPEDRPRLKQEIMAGESFRTDYRVISTDGQMLYFHEEVGEPLFDDDRPVVRRGTVQDVTVNKLAEMTLRESEERLRLLFESMEEIVWSADVTAGGSPLESPISFVSTSVSKIIGFTPAEFSNDPAMWFSSLHPDDVKAVTDSMAAIIEKKKSGTRTYRIRHRDTGAYVWLEETVNPRVDADGAITGLFGVARDITDRKIMEDLLLNIVEGVSGDTGLPFFRSLVTQLRKALGADIAFVGELNQDGSAVETIAVDAHGEPGENFEYSLENTPCRNVIGREICIYPSNVQSRFPQDQDLVDMDIEGYIGTPLFNSAGRPLGIIVVLYHEAISETATAENLLKIFASRAAAELERLGVEQALSLSEEKYRTLFEETKDAVFMASLEGGFIDMNAAGIELLGYESLEEVRRLNLSTDVYAEASDLERYQHDLAESGYVKDYELRLKRKDGEVRTFAVTSSLVRDEDGTITGNWGIGRDITRHRELEEQLIQAQKMESIGRLAGGIAHDFNNFLTAVQGYIEMAISDLPLNSPVKPELVEAARSADRAVDVTRQLLLFSRHGQMSMKMVNLNSVVEGIFNMLSRLIGERYEIHSVLDRHIKPVRADPGHIEQVLLNLVVNARDAMVDGGRITVGTKDLHLDEPVSDMAGAEHFGEYVCLWVEDEGEGMDDSVRSKIFEPFFSTKSVGTGTGLGLSVVYGIIEQHNGWVEVESQPGVGSTFRVYLPVVAEDADQPDVVEAGADKGQLQGSGERILLVEDEEIVRSLAMKMLTESGYQVMAATDAHEAISIFSEAGGNFNLLFSDVVLPGISGLRLADELRQLQPEIKVLLVSGYTGEVIDRDAIVKRGYHFLQKPYSLSDLLLELKKILHGIDR